MHKWSFSAKSSNNIFNSQYSNEENNVDKSKIDPGSWAWQKIRKIIGIHLVLEREENQTLKEEGVKNGEERGASPLSSPIARLNSDHVYHVPPFVRHSEINSLFVYFESSPFSDVLMAPKLAPCTRTYTPRGETEVFQTSWLLHLLFVFLVQKLRSLAARCSYGHVWCQLRHWNTKEDSDNVPANFGRWKKVVCSSSWVSFLSNFTLLSEKSSFNFFTNIPAPQKSIFIYFPIF